MRSDRLKTPESGGVFGEEPLAEYRRKKFCPAVTTASPVQVYACGNPRKTPEKGPSRPDEPAIATWFATIHNQMTLAKPQPVTPD